MRAVFFWEGAKLFFIARRGTQPAHGESGTFQARRLKVLVFIVES
jgi:hypothetical protein